MWLFPLLILGSALSGEVFAQTAEVMKTETLAKGMVLQYYSQYLQSMLIKKRNQNDEDIVQDWKLIPPTTKEQLVAAIYERYSALLLHINFLGCRIFYTLGAALPEAGDYDGCFHYSEYIYWYNGQFPPQLFYEKYAGSDSDLNKEAKLHIGLIAEKLTFLYQRMGLLNEIFTASKEKNYENFFQLLADTGSPMTEEDGKKIDKEEENTGIVENLEQEEATTVNHLIKKPAIEEERQRSHYKVTEESELEVEKKTLQDVHEIQYAEILYHGLQLRVENVPEVLPERNWQIVDAPPDKGIDYLFEFLEETETATIESQTAQVAAASASGSSSAAGGSSGVPPGPSGSQPTSSTGGPMHID